MGNFGRGRLGKIWVNFRGGQTLVTTELAEFGQIRPNFV